MLCLTVGKATRAEGNTEVEAAKVMLHDVTTLASLTQHSSLALLKLMPYLQAKGYAEGAGDSLAGGLKKNVAKVTGNDQKEAEGKHITVQFDTLGTSCQFQL